MPEKKQAVGPEDIERCLAAISFPAEKDDILLNAQSFCASEEVISELKKLPERTYKSRRDVIDEYEGLWGKMAA